VVDSHISRLRGKIGADLIHTLRGAGYCVRAPDGDGATPG
jgi:DNA-binding response OmpR family regulator